eukprot:UN13885
MTFLNISQHFYIISRHFSTHHNCTKNVEVATGVTFHMDLD